MTSSKATTDDTEWQCSACGTSNSGNFCTNCGAAKSSEESNTDTTGLNAEPPVNLLVEYQSQAEYEMPRVISELKALWEENDIRVPFPKKELGSRNFEDKGWDRYIIADDFEIIYSIEYDGSGDSLLLDVPTNYAPASNILILSIEYMTGTNHEEAQAIYDSIIYNLLNRQSGYVTESCDIGYYDLGTKYCLVIIRSFSQKKVE